MKKLLILLSIVLSAATTGLFAETTTAPVDTTEPAPAQPSVKPAKPKHGKHAKHASKRHKKHHGKKTPPSAPSTAPAPEDTPAQK